MFVRMGLRKMSKTLKYGIVIALALSPVLGTIVVCCCMSFDTSEEQEKLMKQIKTII